MSKNDKNADQETGDDVTVSVGKKNDFLENVISLSAALALALLIKFFLIEPYSIPSGSMEPTLHGRPDGGDRVVSTKVEYLWRQPKRWEIFVFKFPYETAVEIAGRDAVAGFNGQNFIKRCVGLPDERVTMVHGNIYTRAKESRTWELQSKPDAVLRSLWIPVYEEDFSELVFDGKGQTEDLFQYWRHLGSPLANVEITPGKTLKIVPEGECHIKYRPRIRAGYDGSKYIEYKDGIPDRYIVRQAVTFKCPEENCGKLFRKTVWDQKISCRCPHCGKYVTEENVTYYDRRSDISDQDYPSVIMNIKQGEHKRIYSYHLVADLRLTARVKLADGATLGMEIRDGKHLHTGKITGGINGLAKLGHNGQFPEAQSKTLNLDSGKWHDVEFYLADGWLRMFIDSVEAPALEWNRTETLLFNGPGSDDDVSKSGVMLSVSGGAVEFDKIAIDRDIHYFYDKFSHNAIRAGGMMILGNDQFMALGDNCPASTDSRVWGTVPRANLKGPAHLVWWPPHRIHWLSK